MSSNRLVIPKVTALLFIAAAAAQAVPFPRAAGAGDPIGERPPDAKCGLRSRLFESGMLGPRIHPAPMATPEVRSIAQAERTIGLFRFLYDTTGANAPALLDVNGSRIPGTAEEYVDSAGAIFNAVFEHQTVVLGYASPFQPGQDAYVVHITSTSPYYGWTDPESRIGSSTPSRWTSSVYVDQDFAEFSTRGLDGLRVTAAHEFFHAVQFASYGYWAGDEYFMELSSTWMEEVIFDEVNDYYQYIRGPGGGGTYTPRGQFAHPDSSFTVSDGLIEYSRGIFGIFLEKKYSPDVIRRAWERVTEGVAITALDRALSEYGSSFREAFLLWSVWNAHTGPTADTSAYYPEARQYPNVRTAPVIEYTPPSRSISGTIGTNSAAYHPVILPEGAMSVIVANVAGTRSRDRLSFTYDIADRGDDSYKHLSNGLYVRLNVSDPENWSTIESAPPVVASVTPAPNPYAAGEGGRLRFLIPDDHRPESVRLTLLTGTMERAFQGPLDLREDLSTPFVQVAEWDGRDDHGSTVGSGIYIYVLDVDGSQHTGKIAVIR